MKEKILNAMEANGLIYEGREQPVALTIVNEGIGTSDFYRKLSSTVNNGVLKNDENGFSDLELFVDGANGTSKLKIRANHKYTETEFTIGKIKEGNMGYPLKVNSVKNNEKRMQIGDGWWVQESSFNKDREFVYGSLMSECATYEGTAILLEEVLGLALRYLKANNN